MNLSHSRLINSLRSLLSNSAAYRPLRYLFNKIFLFRARRSVTFGDHQVLFWTPTFRIIDDLEELSEQVLLRSFLEAIRADDVVWDVGANFGLYSMFAAKCAACRVVAFEPERATHKLLRRNISINGLTNVTAMEYALDREEATKIIFPSATPNPGSHSLVQRTDYRVRNSGFRINAVRGDLLIAHGTTPTPNILKIDVEGAELNVLEGLRNTLTSGSVRFLLLEVHPLVLPHFGNSEDEVESLVRSVPFTSITRMDRGSEYHLICRQQC